MSVLVVASRASPELALLVTGGVCGVRKSAKTLKDEALNSAVIASATF